MKKIMLLLGLSLVFSGVAFAKPAFKKDLGMASCTECHVQGKMKEPSDKPLYIEAKKMVDGMAKGEKVGDIDYAGATSCNVCHLGQQKAKKKSIKDKE
ncbi:MAG: hypothetical protein AABZ06_01790 [Bdellovibrionota bacterium]